MRMRVRIRTALQSRSSFSIDLLLSGSNRLIWNSTAISDAKRRIDTQINYHTAICNVFTLSVLCACTINSTAWLIINSHTEATRKFENKCVSCNRKTEKKWKEKKNAQITKAQFIARLMCAHVSTHTTTTTHTHSLLALICFSASNVHHCEIDNAIKIDKTRQFLCAKSKIRIFAINRKSSTES